MLHYVIFLATCMAMAHGVGRQVAEQCLAMAHGAMTCVATFWTCSDCTKLKCLIREQTKKAGEGTQDRQ